MASTICALSLCEGLLRLTRGRDRYFPYEPHAVYVFYPSEELTPGISGISYFSTNSFGCRGPELNGERHRLLVIGGSTTACTALDDASAWPALVMQDTNARLHDPSFLWVTNSGIDGLNSRHHMMHARYLVPRIPHLDHVLIYAGLNDVGSWLFHDEFDSSYLESWENYASTIAESFHVSNYTSANAPWYKRLELWKRASLLKVEYFSRQNIRQRAVGRVVEDKRMSWIAWAREQRRHANKGLVPRAKLDTLGVALDAYENNLQDIVNLVRHGGAEPIMMAQAVHYRGLTTEEKQRLWMGSLGDGATYVDENQMADFVDQYNQRMRKVAERNNVAFIDLPALLPSQHDIFYDDCHFTENGARIVAELVSDFLTSKIYTSGSVGTN